MWAFANKLMIVVTICVCIVQMASWYGDLPDPIASHFDANGEVDGMMGKNGFYILMGLVNLIFLVGFPILGLIIRQLPDSMINLPNKEYWLAPDRRSKTFSTSSQFLVGIGWISGWLMIGIFHLTAEVSIGNRQSISPEFYYIMAVYLAAVIGGTIFLCLKFRIPRPDIEPQLQ